MKKFSDTDSGAEEELDSRGEGERRLLLDPKPWSAWFQCLWQGHLDSVKVKIAWLGRNILWTHHSYGFPTWDRHRWVPVAWVPHEAQDFLLLGQEFDYGKPGCPEKSPFPHSILDCLAPREPYHPFRHRIYWWRVCPRCGRKQGEFLETRPYTEEELKKFWKDKERYDRIRENKKVAAPMTHYSVVHTVLVRRS